MRLWEFIYTVKLSEENLRIEQGYEHVVNYVVENYLTDYMWYVPFIKDYLVEMHMPVVYEVEIITLTNGNL